MIDGSLELQPGKCYQEAESPYITPSAHWAFPGSFSTSVLRDQNSPALEMLTTSYITTS